MERSNQFENRGIVDGKLARDRINWDIAPCNRCGKDVNTHRNATFQLREVDVDHLKKVVPVRIPVPVVN